MHLPYNYLLLNIFHIYATAIFQDDVAKYTCTHVKRKIGSLVLIILLNLFNTHHSACVIDIHVLLMASTLITCCHLRALAVDKAGLVGTIFSFRLSIKQNACLHPICSSLLQSVCWVLLISFQVCFCLWVSLPETCASGHLMRLCWFMIRSDRVTTRSETAVRTLGVQYYWVFVIGCAFLWNRLNLLPDWELWCKKSMRHWVPSAGQ